MGRTFWKQHSGKFEAAADGRKGGGSMAGMAGVRIDQDAGMWKKDGGKCQISRVSGLYVPDDIPIWRKWRLAPNL